jgi:hypothetical protein
MNIDVAATGAVIRNRGKRRAGQLLRELEQNGGDIRRLVLVAAAN